MVKETEVDKIDTREKVYLINRLNLIFKIENSIVLSMAYLINYLFTCLNS